MNTSQLVMIHTVFEQDGRQEQRVGTGYFILPDLILTANHVSPVETCTSIRVRIEKTGEWITANNKLFWRNTSLDAALISVDREIEIVGQWLETPLDKNENWESIGYPIAAANLEEGVANFKSLGLSGEIYFGGGGGQITIKQLDLTVKAPPDDVENWKGISGAPVLVGDTIVGIIKTVQKEFKERIQGLPFFELLKDVSFRAAISKQKHEIPENDNWALILLSENAKKNNILQPAESAIADCLVDPHVIRCEVGEVFSSPDSFLNYIRLVCKAPIMIIDATGYQPAIMLVMGIRSVVRKSVTIVVNTDPLKESDLSKLPFNIQEIKIFSLHFKSYSQLANLPSKDRLIIAINEGLSQSEKNPDYLDLPAYDAVRKLVVYDMPALTERVLMLCPFDENYKDRFSFIRENLANMVESSNIFRMLDINSPQLVSQSLYEHIRWSKKCVIDWTGWLPNVFYELGVRLASSDIPPVILLDQQTGNSKPAPGQEENELVQKRLLTTLFPIHEYNMSAELFPDTVENHISFINGKVGLLDINETPGKVYFENIFSTAQQYFDWRQEKTNVLPHKSIRTQIERRFGRDWQKEGKLNILYAKNEFFNDAIQRQAYEYWLGAWYYLVNRYNLAGVSAEQVENTTLEADQLRDLISLGESVIAALNKPEFKTISREIFKLISQLKKKLPDEPVR